MVQAVYHKATRVIRQTPPDKPDLKAVCISVGERRSLVTLLGLEMSERILWLSVPFLD